MADIILINDQDQEQTLTGVSNLVTRGSSGDVKFSIGGGASDWGATVHHVQMPGKSNIGTTFTFTDATEIANVWNTVSNGIPFYNSFDKHSVRHTHVTLGKILIYLGSLGLSGIYEYTGAYLLSTNDTADEYVSVFRFGDCWSEGCNTYIDVTITETHDANNNITKLVLSLGNIHEGANEIELTNVYAIDFTAYEFEKQTKI